MKKLRLAPIIAAALIFSACNGNSDTTTNTDSTTNTMSTDNDNMNADTTNNGTSSDVADFAKDAATGGMMEVKLGEIAQKNGSDAAVKNFGKMMVEDHSKLNDEFKALAARKNITLPASVTEDQQDHIDKLSKETGNDFDKDYVSMMVDDHQKDIDEFKDARDKINDPDIKDFINNALPVLEKHLNAIKQIKKID
jgi:putative membrane protein